MPDEAERSLIGAIAANERWARLTPKQREEATRPAREAGWKFFEDQVDPTITDPEVRATMARNLRLAHLQRMALKSVEKRKAAKLAKLRGEDDLGGDAA